MEWPDVMAFFKHWESRPPVRKLLQAALSKFGIVYQPRSASPGQQQPRKALPVDSEPTGTSFDNLPLNVQDFLKKAQSGTIQ